MKYERTISHNDRAHARHIHARVQLAVKTVAQPGVRVAFREARDERFEAAIAFGAGLAAEQVPLAGNRRGLDVTVFFVEVPHLGHSTALIAALAAQCVGEALGVAAVALPRFDPTQGVIVPISVDSHSG